MGGKKITADPKSLAILLDECRVQRNLTLELISILDTKASLLIAFIAILIGVLTTLPTTFITSLINFSYGNLFFIESIVILVDMLIILLYSSKLSRYDFDPELRPLVENYSAKSHDILTEKLISHYVNTYESNLKKIGQRGAYINVCIFFILIVAILLLLSAIIR